MMIRNSTYRQNSAIVLFKNIIVLALIAFVLVKPVCDLVLSFAQNDVELSSAESDQDDSDLNDSQEEEDSEEEQEKIEAIDLYLVAVSWQLTSFLDSNFNYNSNHKSDFQLGIVLPPPERAHLVG
jgi:hypothetical protein